MMFPRHSKPAEIAGPQRCSTQLETPCTGRRWKAVAAARL